MLENEKFTVLSCLEYTKKKYTLSEFIWACAYNQL